MTAEQRPQCANFHRERPKRSHFANIGAMQPPCIDRTGARPK